MHVYTQNNSQMSMRLESITSRNPNPRLNRASSSSSSSMALCHVPPASIRVEALFRAKSHCRVPIPALSTGFRVNYWQRNVRNRSVVSFAASHEESKASGIDIGKEEDLKVGAQESQEAWQQTVASFKEQALKMQGASKEAYKLYSPMVIIILKETSENLKIQAEKTRQDLSVIAKEIAEESKEYLATVSENPPEPVKDIVETFTSSTDKLKDVSKVQDFYVGIPYGALLSLGGFLSFLLTGSIPAIRFGIILGGTLLALSISSLRSWKKGESSAFVLTGQTAIATMLFLRELRLLSTRPFIVSFFTTLISGGVVAFYLYRVISDREQSKESNLKVGPENGEQSIAFYLNRAIRDGEQSKASSLEVWPENGRMEIELLRPEKGEQSKGLNLEVGPEYGEQSKELNLKVGPENGEQSKGPNLEVVGPKNEEQSKGPNQEAERPENGEQSKGSNLEAERPEDKGQSKESNLKEGPEI